MLIAQHASKHAHVILRSRPRETISGDMDRYVMIARLFMDVPWTSTGYTEGRSSR